MAQTCKLEDARSATESNGDSDYSGDRFDQGHLLIILEVSRQSDPPLEHTYPWHGLSDGALL